MPFWLFNITNKFIYPYTHNNPIYYQNIIFLYLNRQYPSAFSKLSITQDIS